MVVCVCVCVFVRSYDDDVCFALLSLYYFYYSYFYEKYVKGCSAQLLIGTDLPRSLVLRHSDSLSGSMLVDDSVHATAHSETPSVVGPCTPTLW